jgi:hypothetical protein
MKFLKLFESKYYDEFEKLKQITGVNEIEDDIKDTIQELIDDFNFFRFNNPQTLLQLTYQRKVKRTTSIELDYYQKIVDENGRISSAEGSYITGFMDKLTYGESLYFFKVFQFQLLSNNIKASQEDLNTMKSLKESLLIIFKRLESLGFTPILSYRLQESHNIIKSVNSGQILTGIDSLNEIFNELEALVKSTLEDENNEGELWNQTRLSNSNYLFILQEIDFNKPKIDTKEVPSHLTTSFEDFIKKHRISREGQEELRQLLKNNMLKESLENKDDFEEVKQIVKEWFYHYTDDHFKVFTGRVEIHPNSTCPDCKESHNLVSVCYDYDSGKSFYECPDCEWQGSSDQIKSDLEFYLVTMAQFLEGEMNSINVQSQENFKWMLNYLNEKDIKHLNSQIEHLGYSVFRCGVKKGYRPWITTITSLDNIKKCYDFLNDEFINSDYQILIPKL